MINIHHEILPDYQNAQSVIWQLYNGSKNTGYTIHRIDSKIDHGAILYQQSIPITFRNSLADTVAYTFAQNMMASTAGLNHVICHLDELIKSAREQGKGKNYTTPTLMSFIKILRMYKRLSR
jgi:methionyl-tRNA formyltransferase